jgi:molybdopterin/thiamine biosynthesis adenylyltransferase
MTGAPEGTAMALRDDRTRRALVAMTGEERADRILTHFSAQPVEVYVLGASLNAPNVLTAATMALNMLTRFVGVVELRVVGPVAANIRGALDSAITNLQRIDHRSGHAVRWSPLTEREGSLRHGVVPGARLWLADIEPVDMSGLAISAENDIHVSFDSWMCGLRRGAASGPSVQSSLPFGSLVGVCFGVAEVFKTLIATALPPEERIGFRRRFTHDFRFSTWTSERIRDASVASTPVPTSLPHLELNEVLQIGAGAVGNGSVLTFTSCDALAGFVTVVDTKCVDVKNLNRCYFFNEDHVGLLKTDVLADAASRPDFQIRGLNEGFQSIAGFQIALSTVDNNTARHRVQEALPRVLIEGATGGTVVSVSVHRPLDERSCLVCRHPDPMVGVTQRVALDLNGAAGLTGLTEVELSAGRVDGMMTITDALLERVGSRSKDAARFLAEARDRGQDLCGALGDLRSHFGSLSGPQEASVPFVSNLAGVLAAIEVVKEVLRHRGSAEVPALDNVLEIDLGRNYARHEKVSFREPPHGGCAHCQQRAELIATVLAARAASVPHQR